MASINDISKGKGKKKGNKNKTKELEAKNTIEANKNSKATKESKENKDKILGITILTHSDNYLLHYVLHQFITQTLLPNNCEVTILTQKCSQAYNRSIEHWCVEYAKLYKDQGCKFGLHTEKENLGIGRANNFLYNATKHCDYVLHL